VKKRNSALYTLKNKSGAQRSASLASVTRRDKVFFRCFHINTFVNQFAGSPVFQSTALTSQANRLTG
jgi:hypothetical protein